MRGTIPENFRSRKKLILKISSLLGFGHARAAFGQTPFSPVWYYDSDLILHIMIVRDSLHDLTVISLMFCLINYA